MAGNGNKNTDGEFSFSAAAARDALPKIGAKSPTSRDVCQDDTAPRVNFQTIDELHSLQKKRSAPTTPLKDGGAGGVIGTRDVCQDDTAPRVNFQTIDEFHSLQNKRSAPTTPLKDGGAGGVIGTSGPTTPLSGETMLQSVSASLASLTRETGPKLIRGDPTSAAKVAHVPQTPTSAPAAPTTPLKDGGAGGVIVTSGPTTPLSGETMLQSVRNQYVDFGLEEDISRDLYQKVFPTERIGIYSRLLEIKNLLCKQSWGIRSIGIWGMPGIGKTTLAKAAFDQMSGDYEASCFIEDFDLAFRENGLYGLLKEHFGKTLMEEFDITGAIAKPTQKRVLIVLDNVCKPLDAESFLNGFKYFGPGSLIIITSRNKQVFVQCCINQIYEVKGLNESEAKQLFSRCASRKGWGTESDQETLTPLGINHLMSVIEFASGNPLVLSLYAKLLSHKTPKEMETECLNLKRTPPSQIMKAFKSSYDTLSDNEKTMFLDIACFFSGEDVDYVMQLFGGCGFFPLVGIYVLVEKCLVTISENKVQMHNLIEIIGREVAHEEIVHHERHCRLWDASIIQPLLEDEEIISPMDSEGVEDIEAIFLEISNLNFFVKSIAFKSMHNLRFLKIYSSNPEKHQGLRFHKTLESLPNELRLLHWEDYPLHSLPQDFDPKHLVELNMPYSQLHILWGGTKTLEMLKTVRLCHSEQLVEIDDLLKAQNIEVIDLRGCIRFQRFIATGHLQHLRVINLTGCVQLNSIPEVPPSIEELYLSGTGIKEISTSSVTLSTQDKLHCRNCRELVNLRAEISSLAKALNLKHDNNDGCLSLVNSTEQDSLKVLDLSGCSDLKNIQAFPRNLKELYLSETAIRELSSSISFLTALNVLDMTNCKGLQHLPMGMSNLTSLVKLMLSGCSKLESIQDFPRNLKELYLAGTAIKEVPSSLCDLSELVKLDAGNCKRLENLPIGMCNLISLVTLTLSGCSELEDIHDLPRNLQILNLAETPIREMPSSFEDLTELIALDLNNCEKLQHLRMGFFRSAVRIELSGCSELEYILGFSLQSMVLLHIDGTNKVMLHGPPPCKVSLIWENWRRFQLLPREMTGSKFILTLMPSVTTPYGSKLPFSMSSSLVSSMYAVVSLLLSNTFLSDIHIPQEICHFPSLKTLDLEGSGFRKLPESLKQIRNLKSLILCHCPNLESLPELPQSLELLNAHSCVSLKNIHWSFEQFPRDYTFFNCFNLSPELVTDFLEKGLASVANMAREDLQKLIKAPVFNFSVPASVSLKTIFHLQRGSFVNIRLTTRIETLLGFRLSVVVSFLDNSYKDTGFGIRCVCKWENMKGLPRRLERIFDCSSLGEVAPKVRKDHMFVFCDVSMYPGGAEGSDLDILNDLVLFEFLPVNRHNRLLDDCCMITKCGVDVIAAATKVTTIDLQPTTFVSDEAISDNLMEKRVSAISYLEGEEPELATPFGIEHRIKQVKEKLDFACCDETRIVGIVGMPGIGKTTLATILFKEFSHRFIHRVAFMKIREKWMEFGPDRVRKMFLEDLLQNTSIDITDETTHDYLERQLLLNKFFVVLDDVSSKRQIEVLLGNRNWIKKGSRIVITTRDRASITELDPNPYVVPRLNLGDGLMYFSFYAFEDHICNPEMGDYMKMSREFVDYAGGNPLVLRVLGRDLLGKRKEQWRHYLDRLSKIPNKKIQSLLKFSYDELTDQEKNVFLDIACFFRSEDEYYVRSLLDSGDNESFEAAREITDLSHKFFISISGGCVEMHDLLHSLAMELCSLASCRVSGKKRRLWNSYEIIAALHEKMETKTVRGIFLDMSEVRNMALDRLVFTKMCNLRYLKLYNSTCPLECEGDCKLKFPDGLSFPLKEVRYLDWLKFPLEELPSDFTPNNLVDLRLPYSKIKQVWKGSKDTPKLKWVDLNNSRMLQTLSGFSKAPNLLRLNLEGCISLDCLSEEMKTMESLVFLNLRGCTNLRCLPEMNLSSLTTLILSGCLKLREFPLISENTEYLYLDRTAIEYLPSDIVKLQRLILLNLKECRRLESVPECIGQLKALQELILSGCSNLKSFPNVEDNMESFRVLLLDGTSIEEVPKILQDNNSLSFLRRLSLSRNDVITSLGSDISQLYHLKWLDLKYCKKLRSLSTLPPNLQCLDAHGCISLQTVTSPLAFLMPMEDIHSMFIFTNCCKLNDAARNDIASHIRRKCQLISDDHHNGSFVFRALIGTCYPGYEVPPWFSHQAFDSVLEPKLPPHWCNNKFLGLALCAIVSFHDYRDQNNSLLVKCTCEFENLDASCSRFSVPVGGWFEPGNEPRTVESDHVFIGYISWLNIKKRQKEEYKKGCVPTKAKLIFTVTDGTGEVIAQCEVVKCGVGLVYEPDDEVSNVVLSTRTRMIGEVSTLISEEDVSDYPDEPPTSANKFYDYFKKW